MLNDLIFKKVFCEKGNEAILISFINAVLKRTNKEPIVEIEIIDNNQLADQGNIDKRRLFYWRKMYLENIKQGEDYKCRTKSILK